MWEIFPLFPHSGQLVVREHPGEPKTGLPFFGATLEVVVHNSVAFGAFSDGFTISSAPAIFSITLACSCPLFPVSILPRGHVLLEDRTGGCGRTGATGATGATGRTGPTKPLHAPHRGVGGPPPLWPMLTRDKY
eukprot:gene12349-biopygen18473